MSSADGATAPDAERADAGAWLAVAAGTIGALMATLDTNIVNSALPTIQGEIGASGSEGTWISTAYLVAEIVMIPLAGWLERKKSSGSGRYCSSPPPPSPCSPCGAESPRTYRT